MAVAEKKKPRRRKLKKKYKIRMIVLAVIVTAAVALFFPLKKLVDEKMHPGSIGNVKVDWYKDLNLIHLKHAKANGVAPFQTNKQFDEQIEELLDKGSLVKVTDNRYYRICKLTHSHPYLTPAARDFLDDLGELFSEKLDENDLPHYYYQISSLLRTDENQKKLRGSNGNATSNSSHRYGTTFDIPYVTLIKPTIFWNEAEITDGRATKLLSEALGELRREGRCVVVTERNEACFHVTITR